MSEKILITGVTGFIGANLAHTLCKRKGIKIYAVIRKNSNLWRLSEIKKRIHFINCDIRDYAKINLVIKKVKPDIIYHCAAYGAVYDENDFDKTISTNLIGTINLVNACKDKNIKAFINLGSSSEYGPKKKPMSENDKLSPNTVYGISKAVATQYAVMAARNYKIPLITLRPFSPFGYYESKNRLFPSLILSIIKGEQPKLAHPRSARDFIFIDDLIELILEVTGKTEKYSGEVFNAGTGKQYTVEEVANIAIKVSGTNLKPIFNALKGRDYDSEFWVADMSKTFSAFRWRPKYNIKEAIKILIPWFSKNIKLYE
ncbi:MAG: NAD(P)-dependent oxidoreductase [Candidatus Woesearchaeota archaeon]